MKPNRTVLIVSMGFGGLAPLMRELDAGLRSRGLANLIWTMGGGDGGLGLLRNEGLAAFSPLRDDQILHHLDVLPAKGYVPTHPRMEFYRSFERGSSTAGKEGLELISRWGMAIRNRAAVLLDILQPNAMLVQSGVRLVEGALADLARERRIPTLFMEKGAFPETVLVDEQGVGPLSLYGDPKRWDLAPAEALRSSEIATLEAFRRRFRQDRASAWHQPIACEGKLRARLGLRANQSILFVPGQVRHDANTVLYSPHFPDNESFLKFLLKASEGLDLFILAKPHPMEVMDENHFAKLMEGRGAWLPDLNIHDALEAADMIACLNSTVGLEALVYNKPVISGARAFWAGKSFSLDLLDNADPEILRGFLANPEQPNSARLDPFLHHLLTQGSYGLDSGPWPDMDALASRLEIMARPGKGDLSAARAWMIAAEVESLRREREIDPPEKFRVLLPFFD
jgi:hypothetical protein